MLIQSHRLPQKHIQKLVGSITLQDLSDAIDLTSLRLAPEERWRECNHVVDEKLRLAASLMDQIEEADHTLSKLLPVLRLLLLQKDSAIQQLIIANVHSGLTIKLFLLFCFIQRATFG